MPFYVGNIREVSGPVDPGFGVPGYDGGHPSGQPLPPGPVDPGFDIPLPPVTINPMPPLAPPVHPGNRPPGSGNYPSGQPLPPTYPVDPGFGLPRPPHIWPMPPRPVDPNFGIPAPIDPSYGLPIFGPAPDNELPLPPGSIWPPLPPEVSGTVMALVWLVGVGYRWTVIDTSLKPSVPIAPGAPARPDQGLPPTAEPKTGP